jgi:hypothetical protein
MKRRAIAIAVSGYSLLETILLLGVIVPSPWMSGWPNLERLVPLSQVLLIPGMAILWSRILHGPHQFGRRALFILFTGTLGVPVAVTSFVLPIALLAWAFAVNRFLFAALMPIVVGVAALGTSFLIRKGGRWGAQSEAQRWLRERQSDPGGYVRKNYVRVCCISSWIPVLTVLFVFVFLPEIWGLISHLARPGASNLAGYQVPIPMRWIVLWGVNQGAEGRSVVNGLAARGLAFGIRPNLDRDWSFSTWSFWTADSRHPDSTQVAEGEVVNNRQNFDIGGENLTCLDYPPAHFGDVQAFAYVRCASSATLRATYFGPRKQLETFYAVLSGITRTPNALRQSKPLP